MAEVPHHAPQFSLTATSEKFSCARARYGKVSRARQELHARNTVSIGFRGERLRVLPLCEGENKVPIHGSDDPAPTVSGAACGFAASPYFQSRGRAEGLSDRSHRRLLQVSPPRLMSTLLGSSSDPILINRADMKNDMPLSMGRRCVLSNPRVHVAMETAAGEVDASCPKISEVFEIAHRNYET